MPNKQNAKKALRRSIKRAARNLEVKNTYKLAVKTVKKAVVAGKNEVKEELRLAQKALDKAAKRGVLKKNTAARKLSRLTKSLKTAIKK
jgi:small subunit ribosomal protein S20